jgi:hypothetical protein
MRRSIAYLAHAARGDAPRLLRRLAFSLNLWGPPR